MTWDTSRRTLRLRMSVHQIRASSEPRLYRSVEQTSGERGFVFERAVHAIKDNVSEKPSGIVISDVRQAGGHQGHGGGDHRKARCWVIKHKMNHSRLRDHKQPGNPAPVTSGDGNLPPADACRIQRARRSLGTQSASGLTAMPPMLSA